MAALNFDEYGKTPLERAIFDQNIENLRLILQDKPNVNELDEFGVCPLAAAFLDARVLNLNIAREIAEMLLTAGARLDRVNDNGQNIITVIYYADDIDDKVRIDGIRFFLERGVDGTPLIKDHFSLEERESVERAYILVQAGLQITQPAQRLTLLWRSMQHRELFIKLIAFAYNIINISANIEKFFFTKVYQTSFRRFLVTQKESELVECDKLLARLVDANYRNFVPDINLYPPNLRNQIRTLMNINWKADGMFLPNELWFIIFAMLRDQ